MKLSVFFCIFIALIACVQKKSEKNAATKSYAYETQHFDYTHPDKILSQLGHLKATYIVTELLFEEKENLRRYCSELAEKGFNLAFVNVQARGFFLNARGLELKTSQGEFLMPGHPKLKVSDPLQVIRKECDKQSPPIAVVPWIEFNGMAEPQGGSDTDTRGIGYNGVGILGPLHVYEGNDTPVNYKYIFQTFYPDSWYLKRPSDNSIFLSGKSGLRWLDTRKTVVQEFLYSFAEKLAEQYGPLQNWDRMRFAPDNNLGLEADRADVNNAQTQMVQRISGMLKSRGGAFWATVIKRAVATQSGNYHLQYGQHWNSPQWVASTQLLIPMTYYSTFDAYKKDVFLMQKESAQLGYHYMPIVGLDMSLAEMKRNYAGVLQKESQWTETMVGQSGLAGVADWYFWPSFIPLPDTIRFGE